MKNIAFENFITLCIESGEGVEQALEYNTVTEQYNTEWVQQRYIGWRACAEEIYIRLEALK